ncbi:hypothetical protein KARL1_197 [Acinetobacter phage KARL-1]|uniref:Uncharacterized protein n=1 Tax=Acinetobacter phage KARL-1 TaxID=2301662 RepID=A0A385IIV3_9CAUD|nr:hypothetical protein HYP70_gp197 [Acinetobacter phage KARL-1]AXY82816.1 hypothetical protein KARL1_197 [Acinetobacter phage KARL-1]
MKITYYPHALNVTLISGFEKSGRVTVYLPEWAAHVAVDKDGTITAFSGEPIRRAEDWDTYPGSNYEVIAEVQDVVKRWEDTCISIDQLNYTTTELILLKGDAS